MALVRLQAFREIASFVGVPRWNARRRQHEPGLPDECGILFFWGKEQKLKPFAVKYKTKGIGWFNK
jgi:hypothetical protein